MSDLAADYALTIEEAEFLLMVVAVKQPERAALLARRCRDRGVDDTIALFAQVVGMANSVVENNREMIELLLITEGGEDPHTAEQANLPTMRGALQGVAIAAGVDANKVCHGCAYRLGSAANQSPITSDDARWVLEESHRHEFLCHEDVDERGNPKHLCRGFGQARKRLATEAISAEVTP